MELEDKNKRLFGSIDLFVQVPLLCLDLGHQVFRLRVWGLGLGDGQI